MNRMIVFIVIKNVVCLYNTVYMHCGIAQKYFKIDDAIISEKDIIRTDLQMMESLNVYKRAFQCVILFSIIVVK